MSKPIVSLADPRYPEASALYAGTPLLRLDSPLYLKRLARELNALGDGFYADHGTLRARFSRARYSKGRLEAKPLGCARGWIDLTDKVESISDAYGRAVYASRTP